MMAHRQGNSQRGVGTACHSEAGSHNQGCHWRKCLESCIETQREGQKEGKREEWQGGTQSRAMPHTEKNKGQKTGPRMDKERERVKEC